MADLLTVKRKNVTIADFLDTSILNQPEIEKVGQQLQNLADRSNGTGILIDMKRVEFLSSSMIGKLIELNGRCEAKGLRLALCNLSSDLAELMKVTNLNRIFEIFATRREALDSLAK